MVRFSRGGDECWVRSLPGSGQETLSSSSLYCLLSIHFIALEQFSSAFRSLLNGIVQVRGWCLESRLGSSRGLRGQVLRAWLSGDAENNEAQRTY
jgi:hypothetical protein